MLSWLHYPPSSPSLQQTVRKGSFTEIEGSLRDNERAIFNLVSQIVEECFKLMMACGVNYE